LTKKFLKPLSVLVGASIAAPLASLVGLPMSDGFAKLLTAGVTGTIANVLTTIGTDALKERKSQKSQNHDLQKGALHALENSLKQLMNQLDEDERFIYKELIDETIRVLSAARSDINAMDEIFRDNPELASINDYYFSKGSGYHSTWEGIKYILLHLHVSDEVSWATNDASIQRLLAKMQALMPAIFETNIKETLKSEEYAKTWTAFQHEILQVMMGLMNQMASASEKIKQEVETIKPEMDRVSQELGGQLGSIKDDTQLLINMVGELKTQVQNIPASQQSDDSFLDLPSSLRKIDADFLSALREPDEEKCQLYYKGAPLTWDLVCYGYTAERRLTQDLLNEIQKPGFQLISVLGAGGEGKTTILMQAAVSLAKQGAAVYFVDGMGGKVPHLDFIEDQEQDVDEIYLFIDNSVHYSNMKHIILKSMKSSAAIKIIMANRQNMWSNSPLKKNVIDNLIINGSRQHVFLKVNKLFPDESLQIAKLLVDSNTVSMDRDLQEISRTLLDDTNGFLLAAMLTATHGQSLKSIIHSVLKQIQSFENGERILEILAVISVFDVVAHKNANHQVSCKKAYLVDIFDGDKGVLKLLSNHLGGEILNSHIVATTRHESIAQLFMNLLFDLEGDFVIDAFDTLQRILKFAVERSKKNDMLPEVKLLYQITRYFCKLEDYGYEFGRNLYDYITDENPELFKVWVEWAKHEIYHKNYGEYWIEKSARWLLHQATQFSPNRALPWNSWITLEKELGNIGSQEKMYTARWIAKESSLRNPTFQELWVSWAELEELSENYGNIETPYSARWIYKEIADKNTNSPIWHKWLQLEYRLENWGSPNEESSFYWITEQAKGSKNYTIINLRVEVEVNKGNIGSIEKENSARYILHQNYMVHHEVAILAAKVEYLQGNNGSIDEEFSGRWYLNYAKEHFGLRTVATSWAKLEYEFGELGNINSPYTARGVLWEALSELPAQLSLWKLLIGIEIKENNIGNQDSPYTALWFFEKARESLNLLEVNQLKEVCEQYLTTEIN
jgi:hypothetical protein